MSELIFNETKVKVHNLGPNLPMDDFLLLYNKYNPKYIFISLVYISDLDKINNELNFLCRNLSKKNTTIIIKKEAVLVSLIWIIKIIELLILSNLLEIFYVHK